jgi:ACS family hexuronate transporter-like MFS transporter
MLWLLSLAAPVGALTPFVPGIALAVGVVTIGWTVAQSWFFYQAVLFAELFPKNAAATALGICGAVGAGSGMLVNLGLGPLIERFGYMPVFVAGGLLHPIAAIVLRRVLLPGKGATGPECQKSPTGISTRP